MKKYLTAIFFFITIAGLLTGCGRSADIGKNKATEIALEDAGVTEADVTRLRVSKDRDRGEDIYEVEFTSQNTEYEYEILASNGDIVSFDYELHAANPTSQNIQSEQNDTMARDNYVQADTASSDNSEQAGTVTRDNSEQGDASTRDNREQNSGTQTTLSSGQLTLEDASRLALDRVPGASERDLKIEPDYDDGRQTYEGDIIYDGKEYEFEIDAATGDFLEWKEERR